VDARTSQVGDGDVADAIEAFFPADFPPIVDNVRRYRRGDLDLVLADVTRPGSTRARTRAPSGVPDATPGRLPNTFHVEQTVALYASPRAQFPAFTLQPTGAAATRVAGGVGVGKVEMLGHATFNAAYHLMAVRDDSARALFTRDLISRLALGNELWVAAEDRSLLAYRTGGFLAEAERDRFAAEVTAVFTSIEEAALRLAQAESRDRGAPQPPSAASRSASEILRGSRRGSLSEVEAWTATKPPRRPTLWLLQFIDRMAPFLGLAVGSVFLLVGTMWTMSVGTDAEGRLKPWVDLASLLPVAFMACIGGVGVLFFGIRIARLLQILCFGIRHEATIVDIHKVSTAWGNSIPKALKVSFRARNGTVEASAPLTLHGLTRAKRLREAGLPAQILVSPTNPRRIVFVGSLPTVHPDFD
jgi:hypothetical protein